MVNINKLKLTLLQQEILSFLMQNVGKSFNIRRIAQKLNKTPPGISKAIPDLEKNNLIKIEKNLESGRWSIELNRDNSLITGIKRAKNLGLIYESRIIEFLEEKFPGTTIILFGSYSRGEDTYNSDIDIAIIGSKNKKIDLEKYEKFLQKEINLQVYNSLKKIDRHLRNNLFNGIVLKGGINYD